MARPFSIDLRERVVDAVVRDGQSCRQAAARFGVGVSTAIAWVARFRKTGGVAPGQMGGHRPKKLIGAWRDWPLAVGVAAIGLISGFMQGLPAQQVLLYAVATLAICAWAWRFIADQLIAAPAPDTSPPMASSAKSAALPARAGRAVLALFFAILSATILGFFSIWTVISALLLVGIMGLTVTVGRYVAANRSAFIGLMVLAGLFSLGAMNIEGFSSAVNVTSMLLFAAFLGVACIGQTLVALLGGLDLSIPFVIGAANVGLLYLIGLGVSPMLAVTLVILTGALLGVINGLLSYRLQGQALIVTLGTGFAISGGVRILTSIGSAYSGNVSRPGTTLALQTSPR